jgi:hypothetical protein
LSKIEGENFCPKLLGEFFPQMVRQFFSEFFFRKVFVRNGVSQNGHLDVHQNEGGRDGGIEGAEGARDGAGVDVEVALVLVRAELVRLKSIFCNKKLPPRRDSISGLPDIFKPKHQFKTQFW